MRQALFGRFTGDKFGTIGLTALGAAVAAMTVSTGATPAAAQRAACSNMHYSNSVSLRNGSRYSRDWVSRVAQSYGGGRPIVVCMGNVQNAGAVRGRGRRPGLIVYNPQFMERLEAGNKWAPISVLAHEVGHHYGPYQTSHNPWDRELGADQFSGCVLKSLGASLQDALYTVARALPFSRNGSRTHPPTKLRIQAVTRGYRSCRRGKSRARPTQAANRGSQGSRSNTVMPTRSSSAIGAESSHNGSAAGRGGQSENSHTGVTRRQRTEHRSELRDPTRAVR